MEPLKTLSGNNLKVAATTATTIGNTSHFGDVSEIQLNASLSSTESNYGYGSLEKIVANLPEPTNSMYFLVW